MGQFRNYLEEELTETIKWAMTVKKSLEGPDFNFTKKKGNGIVKRKGKNLLIYKSFYHGEYSAVQALVKDWSVGGSYHSYFLDEHGIELMVKSSGSEMKSTMFDKNGDGGVIWVEIKVRQEMNEQAQVDWGFLKPANKEFRLNLRMELLGGYKGKTSVEKWAQKHIDHYKIKGASTMEEFERIVKVQVLKGEKGSTNDYLVELLNAMWDIIDG